MAFSFGATNTAGQTPGFGIGAGGSVKPVSGFSFGATQTAAATSTAPVGGFFTTSSTGAPAPSLGGGFGTTNTSFGAAPIATTTSAGTGFSFGKPTGQATNLGFAAPTQSISLGAPAATTLQPGSGFDFGKSANLSLTTPNLGTTAPGVGGGTIFATGFGQNQPQPLLQQQQHQIQQPQSVGLGGIDINATKPKAVEGKNDNIKVKESQVPQEIIALVENLEAHIKKQKEISSEIAKPSTSKLFSVQSEIQRLNLVLADISNLVDNNYTGIKLLRAETNESIENAEMAQRTIKTPACLQYENTAPVNYFLNLVQKYESDLIKLREQVEMTEKHMKSMTSFQKLSADDLKNGLQQIHEIFISLAARIHDIHQKVEDQKLQYLNLRKLILQDKTNVFEEIENDKSKGNISKIFAGPTPFSALSGINIGGTNYTTTNKDPWLQNSTTEQQTGTTFGARPAFGDSNYLNYFTGFNQNNNLTSDSGFNLQKPPLGTKRNKH